MNMNNLRHLPVYGKKRSRHDTGEIVGWVQLDLVDYMRFKNIGVLTLHNSYAAVWIDGRRWYLHHLIAGKPDAKHEVDHKNRCKLDCRRSNLRVVTKKQNRRNLDSRGGSSQFRGVSLRSDTGKWTAHATIDGKKHNLGCFDDEEDAADTAKSFRLRCMDGALS